MAETRDFPTSVIASISTGVLLCEGGFSKMHEAAEYLMGHTIWTHHFLDKQLWTEMKKTILGQCPGMPTSADGIDHSNYKEFSEKLEAKFGPTVKIRKGGGLRRDADRWNP